MSLQLRFLLISVIAAVLSCDVAASIDYYVSTSGSDRNPGTRLAPFRTITRARDAVRALRRRNPDLDDTVTVHIHEGRFFLSEPLLFGPEDSGTSGSPTLFRGEGPGPVVISGGRRVTGWVKTRTGGKQFWAARPPDGAGRVRQLWINGSRRTPARHPNAGYLRVAAVPGVTPETEWMRGQTDFLAEPGVFPPNLSPLGGDIVVMNRWVESHLPVSEFDREKNRLWFSRRSVFRLEPGDLFYLQHAQGGLDTAGEWLHDRQRDLLLYMPLPGESLASLDAVVPVLPQLVRIHGDSASGQSVRHLIFRNLEFSHTEWYFPPGTATDSPNPDAGGFVQAATGVPGAIECIAAIACVVERCRVSNVGTYGIVLGRGSRGNRVDGCMLSDLGGGGLKIGEKYLTYDSRMAASENLITNNHIHDGGRIFHSAIGIWIGQSPGNSLIHNHIHDFYYTGISIGWTWGYGPSNAARNLVALNHVHHIGKLQSGDGPILSDLGGIYTLGNHRGSVIAQNIFHHISARVYGGWGIYFDEGTTGILAEQNLVYRTLHGGFHQHYGRENVVRNNIFAFGTEYQIRRTRVERHTSFAFEQNIVLWNGSRLMYGNVRDGELVFDRNVYWPMGGEFRVDSLSFSEWQALGFDRHSTVADPLFVDPQSGDFRLRKGSRALAMGFVEIPIEKILDQRPVGGLAGPTHRTWLPARRLLYNNDGTNILMACDTLTPLRAYERIDPLAGSGVTTFLHNVNIGQVMGYPSAIAPMFRWEPPPESTATAWAVYGRRMNANLPRLLRDTLDPVSLVVDRARLRGMETFLTFRMNELHDVDKPESPLLAPFWTHHPEYRVGGYEGWGASALSYGIPEVREYFFSLLEEACSRYDVMGLELDFMRFPYYFPYHVDSMEEYCRTMTAFVGRVREMTERVAANRGYPILLSARVPTSLRACAFVGLDVAAWCKRGLVDFLTVAPFLSTETDIPVGELKRACGGVPIYTGIEFTIGNRQMTREEKRAAAALLYDAGSDGIYLFNYFVAWDVGLQADIPVLTDLAHPDSLAGKDKLYTVAIPRYPVPNVSASSPLPLEIGTGREATIGIRLVEPRRPRAVRLRIECAGAIDPRDIRATWNGQILDHGARPASAQIFPQPVEYKLPPTNRSVEFDINPSMLGHENTVRISSAARIRVEWIYVAVRHNSD